MPTLDVKRMPSARFRMVTEPAGWERDRSGRQIELIYRHGEETAKLADGVGLRISQGGCETYSNQYEFVIPGRRAPGANWLLKASKLLEEIAPANIDKLVPIPKLSSVLSRKSRDAKASKELDAGGLEGLMEEGNFDGPGYLVEVERGPDKTVLRVSYWIPL